MCAFLASYKHFSAICTIQSWCNYFVVAMHACKRIHVRTYMWFRLAIHSLPIACFGCLLMPAIALVCLLPSFLVYDSTCSTAPLHSSLFPRAFVLGWFLNIRGYITLHISRFSNLMSILCWSKVTHCSQLWINGLNFLYKNSKMQANLLSLMP